MEGEGVLHGLEGLAKKKKEKNKVLVQVSRSIFERL